MMLSRNAVLRCSKVATGMMIGVAGLSSSSSVRCQETTDRGTQFANSLPELPPQCKRFYLIRHGQTDWNKKGLLQGGSYDIPLNDYGLEQAERVSRELSGISLGVVASSHLKRAQQTADAVHQKQPQAKRLSFSNFGEMRFGDFEGKPMHEENGNKSSFEILDRQRIESPDEIWPGGESMKEVERRTQEGLDGILESHKDEKHIAIVAHGRTNEVILASLLMNDVSKTGNFKQGNTGINVIDLDEREKSWSAVLINYIKHTEV